MASIGPNPQPRGLLIQDPSLSTRLKIKTLNPVIITIITTIMGVRVTLAGGLIRTDVVDYPLTFITVITADLHLRLAMEASPLDLVGPGLSPSDLVGPGLSPSDLAGLSTTMAHSVSEVHGIAVRLHLRLPRTWRNVSNRCASKRRNLGRSYSRGSAKCATE